MAMNHVSQTRLLSRLSHLAVHHNF